MNGRSLYIYAQRVKKQKETEEERKAAEKHEKFNLTVMAMSVNSMALLQRVMYSIPITYASPSK